MSADEEFNDELFDYFSAKDDEAFWRAWRKKYCSSSVKTTNILNSKHGDTNICNEFAEEFRSVFQTNTIISDLKFKAELQNRLKTASDDGNSPLVDIDLLRQCLSKMKLKKCPGFDNVSTEHLIHAGTDVQVHLCLLLMQF